MAKPHKGAGIGAAASFIFGAGLNFSPIESGPLSAALMLIGAALGAYAIKPQFWPWWQSLHWQAPIRMGPVAGTKSTVTASMEVRRGVATVAELEAAAAKKAQNEVLRADLTKWYFGAGQAAWKALDDLAHHVRQRIAGSPLIESLAQVATIELRNAAKRADQAMRTYCEGNSSADPLLLLKEWSVHYDALLRPIADFVHVGKLDIWDSKALDAWHRAREQLVARTNDLTADAAFHGVRKGVRDRVDNDPTELKPK